MKRALVKLIKKLSSRINKYQNRLMNIPYEIKCRKLCKVYEIGYRNQYKRIYFYHVRKAAGTSTNLMFLSLGGEDGQIVYDSLAAAGASRSLISGDKIYVGWVNQLIEKGRFFYAFSHNPKWKLALPPKTFTFTCLRDPVDRVISHYRMIIESISPEKRTTTNDEERSWLGDSFSDFLANIPPKHLMNQLYMFSENYNIDEAINSITECNHILHVDGYPNGIEGLAAKTRLPLNAIHKRKTTIHVDITMKERDILKQMLQKEYVFIEKLGNMKLLNL